MSTLPMLWNGNEEGTQVLSSSERCQIALDAMEAGFVTMAPPLEYNASNPDTHRVTKGRRCYEAGNVYYSRVKGLYRVKSLNASKKKPRFHWTRLKFPAECSCEDFQRNGACYHLFACGFEAALTRIGAKCVATEVYTGGEVCKECGQAMHYEERFFGYSTFDAETQRLNEYWLGAHICQECETCIRDDGKAACLCDEMYTCAFHRRSETTQPPVRQKARMR